MYWIILFALIGQGDTSRVRENLNRFDDMDNVAMDVRAKQIASEASDLSNKNRRSVVKKGVIDFAAKDLNVPQPFREAESALIDNIVERVSKPYDKATVVTSESASAPKKEWLDVIEGGVLRKVWGWRNPSNPNVVNYYPAEQPPPLYTTTYRKLTPPLVSGTVADCYT